MGKKERKGKKETKRKDKGDREKGYEREKQVITHRNNYVLKIIHLYFLFKIKTFIQQPSPSQPTFRKNRHKTNRVAVLKTF